MAERYSCPHCEKTSASVAGIKMHMSRAHGGYTDEDVSASVPTPIPAPDDAGSETPATSERVADTPTEPAQPKRVSRETRELNDDMNKASQIMFRHLMGTANESDIQELADIRNRIMVACMGFEFDFDEKLLVVKGRIMLFVMVGILLIGDKIPPIPTILEKIKQQREGNKPSEPGVS